MLVLLLVLVLVLVLPVLVLRLLLLLLLLAAAACCFRLFPEACLWLRLYLRQWKKWPANIIRYSLFNPIANNT